MRILMIFSACYVVQKMAKNLDLRAVSPMKISESWQVWLEPHCVMGMAWEKRDPIISFSCL